MNEIDAIVGRLLRDYEARVAELRARGVEPRPQGVSTTFGCDTFSVSIRPLGEGRVGIDVAFGRFEDGRDQIWGEEAPAPDFEADASALLNGLAAAWPVLSRPFRRGAPPYQPGPTEAADWGALSGIPGIPSLRFVAEGPGLRIEHDGGRFDPQAECLIAVEALLAAGDLLAEQTNDAAAAAAWREVRDLADVLPFPPMGPTDFEARDIPGEEAFYAAKLGTDVERWRGHMLALAVDLREKWKPFPEDLASEPPPAAETQARIAAMARSCGMDEAEFVAMALHEGAIESRQQCFYKLWPETPDSSPAP
jgi:hypothetical protein